MQYNNIKIEMLQQRYDEPIWLSDEHNELVFSLSLIQSLMILDLRRTLQRSLIFSLKRVLNCLDSLGKSKLSNWLFLSRCSSSLLAVTTYIVGDLKLRVSVNSLICPSNPKEDQVRNWPELSLLEPRRPPRTLCWIGSS